MRILEAIHDFLPDHRAGSELYTFHLAQALQRRGHAVELVFTEKRLERAQFDLARGSYEGLPFHELVYNRHFDDVRDLYDDARMDAPIGAVLDAVRPDVLHVQSLVYFGLALVRAAVARGVPIVMTLHEYTVACARGGLLLDLDGRLCDPVPFERCARCLAPYPIRRERYASGGFDELGELAPFARAASVRHRALREGLAPVAAFVAPSRFLAERLIREGLDSAKVVVSDYGFPPLPASPRVERAPGAPLRVGSLGTIADYKGVHVLVDAFARVPRGEATLEIRGALDWFPDYVASLRVRAAGLEGVAFDGPLQGGVAAWLARQDVLVVPSLWYENSPLTIHEAFQAGVPVVTTDLGGMRELVQEGGGVTFARGDAQDLARVLLRLAREPRELARLRASIPAVKSIDADAAWTEALFERVRAGR